MAPIDNTGSTAIPVVGPVYSILAAILARGAVFLKKNIYNTELVLYKNIRRTNEFIS